MKSSPKILFILQLPPPVHGSAMVGRYIKDSRLINETFTCRFVNSSLSRSMNEIGGNPIKKIERYLSILFQTIKALFVFRPDVCYFAATVKGIGFYKDVPVIALLKLFRKKIVLHFHNKGVNQAQNRWLDDKLYRFALKNVKVILLSKRLYVDVEKYVDESDVFICPNGIPDVEWNATFLRQRNNPVPRLLFLSNLLISKGVYVLLDTLRILKDKRYSFLCDFVGAETTEISTAQFEETVKQLNLNEIVVYKGKQYGENKNQIFQQSDIFIFPTFYSNETFGLVNLEAMQQGLPIVTTDEGGIPDIVEDGATGYIVEKQNSEALAERIEKLLNNQQLRVKMGQAGRKKFEEKYTLNIFEMRIVEIIQQLMK
ncbi:MAG: N-acetyl-alpha-D-glucosaminyl L-malate synthase [Candidatus Ordinivivax streblomastigis]|uniref:N-acetyl-alpha-D-glucosaminyl L-malate synthase n=1 Tax=Candidatus Ordinivivax streblomastigis TaxID=2540710 RepID=A0A5M8P5X9_9BACT|nr:MAG: N-acetyl-alpha-D-glucosaminyl L-malate synthase [Candidatus Ordinivivax streblomastigis]